VKLKRVWLLLVALAVALGLVATFALTRKEQPQYFTAKVERGDVHNVVDVTGTINAVTTVLVGALVFVATFMVLPRVAIPAGEE